MALLRNFLPKEREQDFLAGVRRADNRPEILTTINTDISTALGLLTNGVRTQIAALDFGSETLLDVARDLRFRMADTGLIPEDIRTSGLGYSNLLYMATVVVELTKAKEADLTIFLVEEPEAHLHRQLQVLVLEFLLDQARQSASRIIEPGKPEGRLQIVVTTHSPT
ncbi:ATP-dependent nuclease [Arsenophonus endosymbiont of Aphis craccivora]|uniref:ATP-dependent nuclease n=1 Tax=Arsenophonus endosymbiont of Aphis craccivora TaxID=1231049 RepID=UPI001EE16815|nr:AAA family ATPase [Arsenophonus endosymbiont of Aphis craccivora]